MTTGTTIAIVGGGLALAYVVRAKLAADAAVSAAAATIVPKSSLEKVLVDVRDKAGAAATSAGVVLGGVVNDVGDALGLDGPSLVDQVRDQATRQKAADAGYGTNVVGFLGAHIQSGLLSPSNPFRKAA